MVTLPYFGAMGILCSQQQETHQTRLFLFSLRVCYRSLAFSSLLLLTFYDCSASPGITYPFLYSPITGLGHEGPIENQVPCSSSFSLRQYDRARSKKTSTQKQKRKTTLCRLLKTHRTETLSRQSVQSLSRWPVPFFFLLLLLLFLFLYLKLRVCVFVYQFFMVPNRTGPT